MRILDYIVDQYLNRGFGSMNKNDFEVAIFYYLTKTRLNGFSNYDISRELKIPESKVKRLRYEVDLKFVDMSKSANKKSRIMELDKLLSKGQLKRNGSQIQLSIEEPALQKFVEHILKQKDRFADYSFNKEICSISIEDYEVLLDFTDTSNKKKKELMTKAKKLFNDKNLTLKGLMKKFAEGAAEGVGNSLITQGFNLGGLIIKLGMLAG